MINPVGHSTWDEKDREFFRKYSSPGTNIDVVSLPRGPRSIEAAEDFAEVVPLIIDIIKRESDAYDGFIVNCFMDPGVEIAQEVTVKPVVGAGSASILLASYIGRRIGIITVGSRDTMRFFIERVRQRASVNAEFFIDTIEVGVLDIEKKWDSVIEMITRVSQEFVSLGAEVIVLGCTGLAGAADIVSNKLNIPIIDPAKASLKLIETLVSLGIKNPRPGLKRYAGRL